MKKALLKTNRFLSGTYLIIALIILWQVAPNVGWTNPTFIPSFTTVLGEGAKMTLPVVLKHVGVSLRRVLTGFALCVVTAMPLAFILGGALPRVTPWLRTLMQFLSQIPPYILYPVIILFNGPGEDSIAMVIFWSGFWPVLFTTIAGITDLDPRLVRCARAMNANSLTIFFKVVLPGVFPNLMRGIRLGMTFSFLILIGAETMGSDAGIGWLIQNAQRMGNINRIYLGALLAAILGFALNRAMELLESRVIAWKPLPEEVTI
jgi:NitT/TauT family transport system permease protein